ncbi:peptidase M61 [Novosphingobium sp. FSY-8]|uniref:Peptidase M61 n=2 Tax=Novosphingobium ovatum TaxID=1908523 RepID=A0ABW9XEU9_9SPHN|nr:peptidase M61 [Novosphingobium ovatum]
MGPAPAAAPPPPATAPDKTAPKAVPIVPGVPDAVDVPYPGGVIDLSIDASDITRGLYRVTQTVPVAPGTRQIILQLPQWLPGNHAARGTADQLVDLRFMVDGQPVRWWRDPVEVFAFHVELPEGAKAVEARFIHTSPLQSSEGRVTMTPDMLNLQWDRMTLYPAGHYVRQIRFAPSVRFPEGWQVATALDGRKVDGARVSWATVDYETLIDSPIFAGRHYRRYDLGHGVALNVFADKPEQAALKDEHLATYRALAEEGLIAFGGRHFDHYDFLLALSDKLGDIGLEHQRSSENAMEPTTFQNWAEMGWDRNVVPHEFAHSWDGKYRRPAKLWTPDYRQPMQNNLLWVYEGQTQFWGYVLAARSGVQTKDMVLGMMATNAGMFTQWPGREWRSVEDTTHDPITSARRPKPFASLARNEDYYTEGMLVWLEADQIIREGTKGARGIDDFAAAFFGVRNGDWGQLPYGFDDVVAALNGVYVYDWAAFLNTRLQTPGQPAPLAGIERAGYRLVWKDTPNPFDKGRMGHSKSLSLLHSLGVTLDSGGRVTSTRWDSAAFNAGLVTGSKVLAVNGAVYEAAAMKDAITAAKGKDGKPGPAISLIVQRGDKVQALEIAYHDGLRYPWLEPMGSGPQRLDALLAPRRLGASTGRRH